MTADDLIQLAHDGEAADFRDAVKVLLTDRAQQTVIEIADKYDPLEDIEEVANQEDGDEIDLEDDEVNLDELDEEETALAELAAEFSDEELEEICNNMTEEEFEGLDDLSKRFLASYVLYTQTEEE